MTSIFSLTGYSLVNVALILFRQKKPELERKFRNTLTFTGTTVVLSSDSAIVLPKFKSPSAVLELERKFRVPLYPLTPILGIGMNLFLIWRYALNPESTPR